MGEEYLVDFGRREYSPGLCIFRAHRVAAEYVRVSHTDIIMKRPLNLVAAYALALNASSSSSSLALAFLNGMRFLASHPMAYPMSRLGL